MVTVCKFLFTRNNQRSQIRWQHIQMFKHIFTWTVTFDSRSRYFPRRPWCCYVIFIYFYIRLIALILPSLFYYNISLTLLLDSIFSFISLMALSSFIDPSHPTPLVSDPTLSIYNMFWCFDRLDSLSSTIDTTAFVINIHILFRNMYLYTIINRLFSVLKDSRII